MQPLRMLGPLLLIVLLCDAESTCPAELNPLIVSPPVLIGEYGETFSVNCSSTLEDHYGMYWKIGNAISNMEEEEPFVSDFVMLSDWNMTAECTIKLNETFECSKEVEITIYKNPDVYMFPTRYFNYTKEGTLYEMQCDILDVAPVQNLTVRWYKGNQTIKTQTFTNTTKRPVDESSTLIVNISRGEDGAEFRCEAQLDFGPFGLQPPVISDVHRVSVPYAPELKYKTYSVSVVVVNEVDVISLSCEAEGNPPPVFRWTRDGVSISEDKNRLKITQVTTSANYSCSATNQLGSITKQFHVRVIKTTMTTSAAATPRGCPLTLTPAEIVVRYGDPASVNCSTTATDAVGMGWEAALGGTGFEKSPSVIWRVEKLEDWFTQPMCYITLSDDHQCTAMPVITRYKTPDDVVVSAERPGPMLEGESYRLNCDVVNVAPVQNLTLKWYQGNETVRTQVFQNTSVTPVSVSSTLTVTPERHHSGASFRCEAELHLGPKGPQLIPTVSSSPYTAVVLYKPLAPACPDSYAGVEHEFSVDMLPCHADGNPTPTVLWYYQGQLINASKPLNRTQSGKYKAEALNILGMSSTFVDITIEYSPSFTCNDRYDIEEDGEIQTKCEPKGIPKPNITWFKDGKYVVTPQRWTRHNSGEYLLRATNKHGTADHRLYLNVLYAPEFKEGPYETEVTPGENVTFECSAEGNPPPLIHWNYTSAVNVRETTGGRHRNISVTGATSTNAGVYICVATNKIGSVSRSVTLMMTGKAVAFHSVSIWGSLLCLLLLLIFIIVIVTLHKQRKRHGQYSFVPNNPKDGSNIPMTTKSEGAQA